MEPKTIAAIVAALVAGASLAVNVFQAWLLRTRTPPAALIRDVRDALRTVIGQFDRSQIFKKTPQTEIWDRGFKSLALIRETFATSNAVIRYAGADLVPDNIKDIIDNILRATQTVYNFSDSFVPIEQGRDFVPYNDIEQWREKPAAEAALTVLQSYVNQNRPVLERFLSSLR